MTLITLTMMILVFVVVEKASPNEEKVDIYNVFEKCNINSKLLISTAQKISVKEYTLSPKQFPCAIYITKIKAKKTVIKFIHVKNLHKWISFPVFDLMIPSVTKVRKKTWSLFIWKISGQSFFLAFDSDDAIPWKTTMNELIELQLSAVVGSCLIVACQILVGKNFIILPSEQYPVLLLERKKYKTKMWKLPD